MLKKVLKMATMDKEIYNISEYASTNGFEFFAESFVMREQGKKLPSYIDRMIEQIIEGALNDN